MEQFRKDPPSPDSVLCVEIPLLVECGMNELVDEVIVVGAEQEAQVDRLTSSRGISPDEAMSRIGAQMPISEKIKYADRVIWNDGYLESLRQSVREIWQELHLP